MKPHPVTRKDIAHLAGTSVSVVSRALNNSGYVDREKRERILQIAQELNYMPNPIAVSLQKQRTRQLLFYCGDLHNAFNIQMYQGMVTEAEARGYMVLVNGSLSFDKIKHTMVDGIIMPNQAVGRYYIEQEGRNYNLPVVCASYGDSYDMGRPMSLVEVDMYQVMRTALDYLWSMGHRRIAMAAPFVDDTASARFQAYKSWLMEKGIEHKPYLIETPVPDPCEGPLDNFEQGRCAAQIFAARQWDATAVIGFNDDFTLGMLHTFCDLDIKIPSDVSLMGIDGIYTRKYARPLLTTVSTFPEKQGAECVKVLINMIEGKKFRHRTYLHYKLTEGETVMRL